MKGMQPPTGTAPSTSLASRWSAGWPTSGGRGYDALEFEPQECPRDFPHSAPRRARRVRMMDEERALLRRVTAAFSGDDPARGQDEETPGGAPEDGEVPLGDGSSRLYRD